MNSIIEIVVTYVTNALWMTCIIAAVTVFLSRTLRRGPSSYLHALWVAALLLAVLLPVASMRSSRNNDKPRPKSVGAASTAQPTHSGLSSTSSWALWRQVRQGRQPVQFGPLWAGLVAVLYVGEQFAYIADGGHCGQCYRRQTSGSYRQLCELLSSNATCFWA